MAESRMIPDAEQEAAIRQIVSEPTKAALVGSELGTGKSLVAVESILRLNAQTALIICPLATRVGWERTFRSQGWDKPISRITSTKAGKQAYADLVAKKPGVYLIGREYFRRLKWSHIHPDVAVYDEAHGYSNRKSVSFRVIKTLQPKFKIAMSGTFFGNKFQNAWAVTRWLWWDTRDPKRRRDPNAPHRALYVDNSFWRWVATWAETKFDPFAGEVVKGERVPGAFVNSLPCYIRIESKLTTEIVTEKLYVELSPSQRKVYEDIERDMLTWLGEHPLVIDLPITARVRLRQATLGTITFNEAGEIDFDPECKSSKIDALKEFLSDHDEPVLVLTDSKRFAKVAAYRLGSKAALWDGDTTQEVRERLLQTFGREGGPTRLVATIAALGEGVDGLQDVCSTMVWLSKTENNVLNTQVAARLHRRGQSSNVLSVEIVAVDTLDEGVLGRLLETELAMRASLRKEA